MKALKDNSVDAVVTDPPYSLEFMGRTWDSHGDYADDSAFGYYLAGLIDGEGCFRVQRHERGTHTCTFSMKMRRDDRAILEKAGRWTRAGIVRDVKGDGNSSLLATWVVQDKEGCQRLVDILDKYPLRAKKYLDYATWREAVCEWTLRPRGNRWKGQSDQTQAAALKARIEHVREYADPPWSGNGFQDWCRLWAQECLRVLKPGGHLLAFGGGRTHHRMTCAIEDAGFEIRDSLHWIYGSGFPKSMDVSKAIDKAAGAEREVIAEGRAVKRMIPGADQDRTGSWIKDNGREFIPTVTTAATKEAATWEGWGTALKPAHEPIVVARKPLIGTVAANVLEYGTGALNIDGCRVAHVSEADRAESVKKNQHADFGSAPRQNHIFGDMSQEAPGNYDGSVGRWPPNVLLSEEVALEMDIQSGATVSRIGKPRRSDVPGDGYGMVHTGAEYDDTGGASRFFPCFKYQAKAGKKERPTVDGISHPTCKPVALMQWLVRLVTLPGGIVLDPFAGSGTTGEAALEEGFNCILIEREPDYIKLIRERLNRREPTLWD